jgi:hypothetical protein
VLSWLSDLSARLVLPVSRIFSGYFQKAFFNISQEIFLWEYTQILADGNVGRRMGTASRHRFELGRVRCVLLKGSPQKLRLTPGHRVMSRAARSGPRVGL